MLLGGVGLGRMATSSATELCPNCGQPYSAHDLTHDDKEGGMVLVCDIRIDENWDDANREQAVVNTVD